MDLISTNSGFHHSQNKTVTNKKSSKNRPKSANLFNNDNRYRNIYIMDKDRRAFESTKNIKKCVAEIKANEKSLLNLTGKKSNLSGNKIILIIFLDTF